VAVGRDEASEAEQESKEDLMVATDAEAVVALLQVGKLRVFLERGLTLRKEETAE
jgi:hypothetical protein